MIYIFDFTSFVGLDFFKFSDLLCTSRKPSPELQEETPEDVEEAEKPAKKRLNFRFSFRKKAKSTEEGGPDEAETEAKVDEEKEETPPAPYPRQEWKLRNIFKSNKSKENNVDEIVKKGVNCI